MKGVKVGIQTLHLKKNPISKAENTFFSRTTVHKDQQTYSLQFFFTNFMKFSYNGVNAGSLHEHT